MLGKLWKPFFFFFWRGGGGGGLETGRDEGGLTLYRQHFPKRALLSANMFEKMENII